MKFLFIFTVLFIMNCEYQEPYDRFPEAYEKIVKETNDMLEHVRMVVDDFEYTLLPSTTPAKFAIQYCSEMDRKEPFLTSEDYKECLFKQSTHMLRMELENFYLNKKRSIPMKEVSASDYRTKKSGPDSSTELRILPLGTFPGVRGTIELL